MQALLQEKNNQRKEHSGPVVIAGKVFSVALDPFQRCLVMTEVPAFLAQNFAPVAADLATLGFHAPREGIHGLVFAVVL